MTAATITKLRCPGCGSENIAAQQKAFVTQRITLGVSGAIDYEVWTTEDVEYDGPEWYVCRDCGDHAEEITSFKVEIPVEPDPPTDVELRARARAIYGNDNVEIESTAGVSRGDDPGAFVAAWVWVPFAENDDA